MMNIQVHWQEMRPMEAQFQSGSCSGCQWASGKNTALLIKGVGSMAASPVLSPIPSPVHSPVLSSIPSLIYSPVPFPILPLTPFSGLERRLVIAIPILKNHLLV